MVSLEKNKLIETAIKGLEWTSVSDAIKNTLLFFKV